MLPRFLLDTHVLLRWFIDRKHLSRQQTRALEQAVRLTTPVGFSAISLIEIAVLASAGRVTFKAGLDTFLSEVEGNPLVRVLPLSFSIALETASLAPLKDPADRAIVATARVHGLRLVTSDQRIIQSGLVPVVE